MRVGQEGPVGGEGSRGFREGDALGREFVVRGPQYSGALIGKARRAPYYEAQALYSCLAAGGGGAHAVGAPHGRAGPRRHASGRRAEPRGQGDRLQGLFSVDGSDDSYDHHLMVIRA